MGKSVLEMIGGEKHINPHYNIKAESTGCYLAVSEKDYLKEAQELIFSDCKLSDTKTPSVSLTLFEKTVAKLLMRIEALKKE